MKQNWEPRINPHTDGHFWIFDKSSKSIQWGINSLFNNNAGKTGYSQANEWNLTPSHHIQKLIQNGSNTPNVRAKTVKLLERKIGVNLYDLGLGKHKMTSKAQVIKRKNWASSKSKPFVHQRMLSKKSEKTTYRVGRNHAQIMYLVRV